MHCFLTLFFSQRFLFPLSSALRKFCRTFLLAVSVFAFPQFVQGESPNRTNNAAAPAPTITWSPERKLSWQDFKGAAPVQQQQHVAAITACGIGYYTNSVSADQRPVITVYNTFYMQDSWVRQEAADERVLQHEQGHFDLCEIYTRKLRQEIANAHITGANMKSELARIYARVTNDYEARQQAYEAETSHGTVAAAQQRWTMQIGQELGTLTYFASR